MAKDLRYLVSDDARDEIISHEIPYHLNVQTDELSKICTHLSGDVYRFYASRAEGTTVLHVLRRGSEDLLAKGPYAKLLTEVAYPGVAAEHIIAGFAVYAHDTLLYIAPSRDTSIDGLEDVIDDALEEHDRDEISVYEVTAAEDWDSIYRYERDEEKRIL